MWKEGAFYLKQLARRTGAAIANASSLAASGILANMLALVYAIVRPHMDASVAAAIMQARGADAGAEMRCFRPIVPDRRAPAVLRLSPGRQGPVRIPSEKR